MINEELLRKYAYTLARVGINVQKGQPVLVECQIENHEFAKLFAEECYKLGASKVHITYRDLALKKIETKFRKKEDIEKIADWEKEELREYLKEGACTIRLESENPNLLKDVDGDFSHAIFAWEDGLRNVMRFERLPMKQWCIAIVPTQAWAEVVLPNEPKETCLETFWNTLFKLALVDLESDPVKNWEKHNEANRKRSKIIDSYNLKELHFTSSNGTDLHVGLTPNSKFGFDRELPKDFIPFAANLPSEEICTSPDKFRVNGHVCTTRPLAMGGKVIDYFELDFKDGKVVKVYSPDPECQKLIEQLVATDEGSCYLGEVALVQYHSPISLSGLTYYTTLIDENASCHLALGRALGGEYVDSDGVNHFNKSSIHIDFMFGAKDTNVLGIKEDGTTVEIFKNGDFVF